MSSRTPGPRSKTSRTRPSLAQEGSQPDVQISYAAAGHETISAISQELRVGMGPRSEDVEGSAPEISVAEGPAGRETLALFAEAATQMRAAQTTLGCGDRISNAPGAKTPSPTPAPLHPVRRVPGPTSAPEISIGQGAVGQETLASIAAELVPSAPTADAPSASNSALALVRGEVSTRDQPPNDAPFVIFEMLTFVVQGPETTSLSSEVLRRRFVEEHLLRRLPVKSMALVDRVDVTPWTVRGTVVVRVWCKVGLVQPAR